MKLLPVLVLLFGCSMSIDRGHVRRVNQLSAGLMVAATACDYWSTTVVARDGWGESRERGIPTRMIIGQTPNAAEVTAYNLAAIVALMAGSYLVPEKYRWIYFGGFAALETVVALNNMNQTGRRICGL